MKHRINLLLVMILAVALLIGTCFSVSASRTAWRAFPGQSMSSYTSHAYAVQAIMYRYNATTRNYLTNYGSVTGVDGIYGSYTNSAVAYFQSIKSVPVPDGEIGSLTWGYLWDTLYNYGTSGYYTYYRVNNGYSGSTAIRRYYEPTSAGVASSWYAYNDAGQLKYFAV
ncbi:MAG: peptidoglycan-binding protein [Oscillospiraceae bacterium]|nr:peptidoglycan-binding protein [Oscillospiraceae bacterium]